LNQKNKTDPDQRALRQPEMQKLNPVNVFGIHPLVLQPLRGKGDNRESA
jgi:hypothetical protein